MLLAYYLWGASERGGGGGGWLTISLPLAMLKNTESLGETKFKLDDTYCLFDAVLALQTANRYNANIRCFMFARQTQHTAKIETDIS